MCILTNRLVYHTSLHYSVCRCRTDTVVALQALALYSTLVFSPQGSSTVTVQAPSSQMTFEVTEDNKLLYQEKTLSNVTGKYSLEVKGSACVSMQVSECITALFCLICSRLQIWQFTC